MTAQSRALKLFGIRIQRLKLAEECGELAAAASRLSIGPETPEVMENFLEECADVEILLEQMRQHYGDHAVDEWRAKKLARLERRLSLPETEAALSLPVADPCPATSAEPRVVDRRKRSKINFRMDDVPYRSVSEAAKKTKGLTYSGLYSAVHQRKTSYNGHKISYEKA
jgi:NTP pyrophosphatase (non-canonical NTP hydrolase)